MDFESTRDGERRRRAHEAAARPPSRESGLGLVLMMMGKMSRAA
jgi:hypothetical protein